MGMFTHKDGSNADTEKQQGRTELSLSLSLSLFISLNHTSTQSCTKSTHQHSQHRLAVSLYYKSYQRTDANPSTLGSFCSSAYMDCSSKV